MSLFGRAGKASLREGWASSAASHVVFEGGLFPLSACLFSTLGLGLAACTDGDKAGDKLAVSCVAF